MSLVEGRLLREGQQLPRLFAPRGRPSDKGARQTAAMLWRRKHIIVATVLAGVGVSWLSLSQLTPRYEASAFLLISPDTAQQLDIGGVFSGSGFDSTGLQTEIEILRSNEVLQTAVERLGPRLAESYLPARRTAQAMLEPLFDRLPLDRPSSLEIVPAAGATAAPLLANRLRQRLAVVAQGRSRVLRIGYEATDPEIAARVVNTVTDVYVAETLKTKLENSRHINRWLDEQIDGMRVELATAEQAVQDFRRRAGIVEGRSNLLVSEELSELKTQLIRVQSERLGAEARLGRLEELLAAPAEVESMLEVLDSRLIQDLRREEVRIQGQIAELSAEYRESHPRMARLRAELSELQAWIGDEVDRIIASMRNEVAIVREREATVREALDEKAAQVASIGESEIRLRELEREATATSALLEEFLARRKGVGGQLGLQRPDARVITRAAVPLSPTFPRTGEMLVAAFIGSLMLGLFLAFWREQMDYGLRTADQIEERTGMVTIGLVPALRGGVKSRVPERRVLDAPTPRFNEAIQTIQTNVSLCHLQHSPRTVLVASARRREGRSSLVMALARASAADGHRVAVVDADLRRPRLAAVFGTGAGLGLTDFLLGKATADKIIRRDPTSGIDFIPAGNSSPNPAALLQSEAMRNLLAALAADHSLVLIDSPPVLSVPDARVLSQFVDTTVFVARWGKVSGEAVQAALKQLVEVGADVAGVVLSMVDIREHDRRSQLPALLPQA